MVEAPDDWGKNVALTRSRHLIDGGLPLDCFRVGWMTAMAVLGLGCGKTQKLEKR